VSSSHGEDTSGAEGQKGSGCGPVVEVRREPRVRVRPAPPFICAGLGENRKRNGSFKTNIKEKKKEIIPSPVSPVAKIAITLIVLLYLFSKFFLVEEMHSFSIDVPNVLFQ
jgi:hypothetical protein